MLQQLGEAGSARAEAMLLEVHFLRRFEELLDFFANIFFPLFFSKCDVRVTGRQFLGRFLDPPLYIIVIMARLSLLAFLLCSVKLYTAVGEGGLGSCSIIWEVQLEIHQDLRSSYVRLFFIGSMMSSLVILSESVFACGCPKKSFGYLMVFVGSGVLRRYCIFNLVVRSFLFLLGCRFPSSSSRGPISALIVVLFFTNLQKYFGFFLMVAIALDSLRFLSVFIEIFKFLNSLI